MSFVVTAARAIARTLASSREPLPLLVERVLEAGAHPLTTADRTMSKKIRMVCEVG